MLYERSIILENGCVRSTLHQTLILFGQEIGGIQQAYSGSWRDI